MRRRSAYSDAGEATRPCTGRRGHALDLRDLGDDVPTRFYWGPAIRGQKTKFKG